MIDHLCGLRSFADRIDCSGEVFILAIANINRVIARHSQFPIDFLTIHWLLLASYGRWSRPKAVCVFVPIGVSLFQDDVFG